MTTTVYVPRETAAVSLGAHEIAAKLEAVDGVNVVRNGSWGASWLEPMLEVVVGDERIAYGPVGVDDVDGLLEAGFLEGREQPADAFVDGQHQLPVLLRHRVGSIPAAPKPLVERRQLVARARVRRDLRRVDLPLVPLRRRHRHGLLPHFR